VRDADLGAGAVVSTKVADGAKRPSTVWDGGEADFHQTSTLSVVVPVPQAPAPSA
jgi:hypothetical protein